MSAAASDFTIVSRLWRWMRPHQALIWLSLFLLVSSLAAGLLLPYLVKVAVDDHLVPGNLDGYPRLLVAFGIAALFHVGGRGLEHWAIEQAGQRALLDLRMHVFRHLQRLSPSFYDRTSIGRLVSRITTDIEAIHQLFAEGVVTVLGDLVFLLAAVVILLVLNWKLALISFLVIPVLLLITVQVRTRVRRAYDEMVRRRAQLHASLHEDVSGMSVIQMFVQEHAAAQAFAEKNAGMRDAQLTTVWWESTLSAVTEMLGSLTTALILWYGGTLVVRTLGGEIPEGAAAALTLGALFAFVDYMQRFFGPLNDLSQKYNVLQNAMSASEKIFTLLDTPELTPEPAEPVELPQVNGEIRFEHVTFSYTGDENVLTDFSLTIPAGERVAIVGATGSGKSTILKLLTRLYEPQSGTIRLDGHDISDIETRVLRRAVGTVSQDVFLFEGTVLDNVRMGNDAITAEVAREAASRVQLDRIVARFPSGYDEAVQSRGGNLSAGERQLISFARVLALSPPVLALDEATSSVDTQTEQLLQQAVQEVVQGRTAVIVAHRLSTIRNADRILVLEAGRIVEQGTHDELMVKRGHYWSLHESEKLLVEDAQWQPAAV